MVGNFCLLRVFAPNLMKRRHEPSESNSEAPATKKGRLWAWQRGRQFRAAKDWGCSPTRRGKTYFQEGVSHRLLLCWLFRDPGRAPGLHPYKCLPHSPVWALQLSLKTLILTEMQVPPRGTTLQSSQKNWVPVWSFATSSLWNHECIALGLWFQFLCL